MNSQFSNQFANIKFVLLGARSNENGEIESMNIIGIYDQKENAIAHLYKIGKPEDQDAERNPNAEVNKNSVVDFYGNSTEFYYVRKGITLQYPGLIAYGSMAYSDFGDQNPFYWEKE